MTDEGLREAVERLESGFNEPHSVVTRPDLRTVLDALTRVEGELANIKARDGMWSLEARQAVDALEEQYDISLCSSNHMAGWVDRLQAAESRISLLQEVVGELTGALEQIEGLFDYEFPVPLQAPSIARQALTRARQALGEGAEGAKT